MMRLLPQTSPRLLASTLALALGGLVAGLVAATPQAAAAHRPYVEPITTPPAQSSDVSVAIESPAGYLFTTHWQAGTRYIEGRLGERYNLRLTNNTGGRVEVVVSVDGRDVVSGELGDYRNQRGYVLEPYGSVVIEGYRQSLDYVAAFRFADLHQSYSAQRGTPQHLGVIGVAVFQEAGRRRPAPQPIARPTPPPPPRYTYGGSGTAYDGESSGRAESAAPSPDAAPPHGRAANGAAKRSVNPSGGGFAPRPNQMGTAYGESTYSSVRETSFRRRNQRRPDSTTSIYYDSRDGLRARGIPVDPPPYYYAPPPPQPFPQTGFAPPPPRW